MPLHNPAYSRILHKEPLHLGDDMKIASTFIFAVSVLGFSACTQSELPAPKQDTPSISPADIGRRIKTLADDRFEGRAPATPGGIAASQYVADEMKAAGLEPMGENGSYFQPVTLTETTLKPEDSFMTIGDVNYDYQKNAIWWTKHFTDTVEVMDAPLVFVGYGIVAPEYGWNDYAGLDVKGKTVVMLVNDPGYATGDPALFNGKAMTYYGRWTYKYEEAARQGAAAAIIVHETKPASYGWGVVASSWAGPQIDLVFPDNGASRAKLEGWVTVEAAKDLFAKVGLDFAKMKANAAKKGFTPVPMGALKLSAKITNTIKTVKSRNVLGRVKGTKYPDEYVIYTAHWDHLGKKPVPEGEDGIYNGAVDNATGTALILEIGEAFAQNPPERSVLIASVTAEESGLLGSAWLATHPVIPLNKIVGGLNIDAVMPLGRTKDIVVVGLGLSDLDDILKSILDKHNMYIDPDPKPEAGHYYRSDHISLAKKGVPMLYADGGIDHEVRGKAYGKAFEEDYVKNRYHKPTDEYDESWDLSGMQQFGEIMYELGQRLANSRDWPNWKTSAEFRAIRDKMMERE